MLYQCPHSYMLCIILKDIILSLSRDISKKDKTVPLYPNLVYDGPHIKTKPGIEKYLRKVCHSSCLTFFKWYPLVNNILI